MKILIAEDDRTLRRLLSILFKKAGYEVADVENGQAAIDTALTFHPNVIVLDSTMPVMDGLKAVVEMNRHPELSKIAKLILSGHSLSGDRDRALQCGADDYLTKPFNRDELLERVRKLAG